VNVIDQFTLEQPAGPCEKWPLRSRLLCDGEPTGISLPGYVLLHQYETPYGYIFVTDYDDPFEEITNFVLVSKRLRVLSCRWLGAMYDTYLLQGIEWVDDRTFIATIYRDCRWCFTIRSWGIPYIRPRLKMQWLGKAHQASSSGSPGGTARAEPGAPPDRPRE
jgi:hypothetical protein